MAATQRILFATDFSPCSERALAVACSLARESGAQLILLYVLPPPIVHGELVARRQEPNYYEQCRKKLGELPVPEGLRTDRLFEEGDPASVILRVAGDEKCDLIVMGTHGRTGLRRLLMGSVAENVLRKAKCPVLTVKTPFSDAQASTLTRRESTSFEFIPPPMPP
jgi:nucleotide-binding universal stress UspA family protein